MKYRVLERRGKFYPQAKRRWFNDWGYFDTSTGTWGLFIHVKFPTLIEASDFIDAQKTKSVVKIHEYPLKDPT